MHEFELLFQHVAMPYQPLNTDDDDGLVGLGHQDDMFNPLVHEVIIYAWAAELDHC